jgi:hypothetical protein
MARRLGDLRATHELDGGQAAMLRRDGEPVVMPTG